MATLLYCMGEEAEDMLNSMQRTERSKRESWRKWTNSSRCGSMSYWRGPSSIVASRRKVSQPNTSQHSTTWYIEMCKYGELKDEIIRDRLVVGIRDSTLSEKLQLNAWESGR